MPYFIPLLVLYMDKCSQKQIQNGPYHGEVSSVEWEFINMTEQEEDIIRRMHKLVGNKWELIAGRIPGRSAAEIERFWLMKNSDDVSNSKSKNKKIESKGENILDLDRGTSLHV